jgi:hypothetical protein
MAYGIMWSDGWDPNTQSKGNRASVWSGTAGFILTDVTHNPLPYDVVPSLWSVGGGKDGHNPAFVDLCCELNTHLTCKKGNLKGFSAWSRFHSEVVDVYVCIGPFLQDQLEQRAAAHLLGGNSNLHALFGTSCWFSKLKKDFAACDQCVGVLETYIELGNWANPVQTVCDDCLA